MLLSVTPDPPASQKAVFAFVQFGNWPAALPARTKIQAENVQNLVKTIIARSMRFPLRMNLYEPMQFLSACLIQYVEWTMLHLYTFFLYSLPT